MTRDYFKEGKYFDLWSVNHLLSGFLYAGWIIKLGFDYKFIFVSYFILAVAWEIYEKVSGIKEHIENQVMDVVTGVVGVIIFYFLSTSNYRVSIWVLILLTIAFTALEISGYLAYKRRNK